MTEIPENGYIFYKNILILTKKSHYTLLTEFNNLELKYIQEKNNITFEIEDYKEDNVLYWVLKINGNDNDINKTKKEIEDILLKFDKWINSMYQHIYRIDPNIIGKIKKRFKGYNNINIYYFKTILLISGNDKNIINKIIKEISDYIIKLKPSTKFIWVKMPDFINILYRIEPLCKNKYTEFKIISSRCSIFSNNTLKTHILIYCDKLFVDRIWKSINLILKNQIENKDFNNYFNIKYLDLFINNNYINNKKMEIINKYRIFDSNKKQIPIFKEYRNDNILSSSI